MRMPKYKEGEGLERKVYLWLKKWGFPEENYEKLPPNLKDEIRNVVRTAGYITTYTQRANLWLNLTVPQSVCMRAGGSIDLARLANSVPPDEELRKIFSPLTPAESLPYPYKW